MSGPGPIVCDHEQGCITCGDTAVPMRVVHMDEDLTLAVCEDDSGQRASVELGLVDPVREGDLLLVHAGAALQHLGGAAG